MKLILTRHAETLENSRKIVQAYGGTLSELGKEQAEKLALRLKDEKINYLYSSDLERAIKSAKEISLFHQNVPLILDSRIREVDFSKYIGVSIHDFDWRNIKDIESQRSLQRRVKNFYKDLLNKTNHDETALVVSHAGTIKALISVIFGIHYEKIWGMETPKNCSMSSFEINKNRIRTITLNDTTHLKEIYSK